MGGSGNGRQQWSADAVAWDDIDKEGRGYSLALSYTLLGKASKILQTFQELFSQLLLTQLIVLESYQMGTNGQTHYQKFPLRRRSQQVGNAYLVTLDSQ